MSILLGYGKFPIYENPEQKKRILEAIKTGDIGNVVRVYRESPVKIVLNPYIRQHAKKGDVNWLNAILVAKPSYGKSVLAKNILIQQSKRKKYILIINPKSAGDYENLKYPNWNSDRPAKMDNLEVVRNFSFMISDFTDARDWVGLGFTIPASSVIMEILPYTDLYDDIPEKFFKILENLPTTDKQSKKFYEQYGIKMEKVNPQTKPLLIRTFFMLKDYFYTKEEMENGYTIINGERKVRKYILDWPKYWREHPRLLISLDMRRLQGANILVARGMLGKVFKDISNNMLYTDKEFNPFICIDEADKLAPRVIEGDWVPPTCECMCDWVLKGQSEGIEILFISQSVKLLAEPIIENRQVTILGHVEEDLGIPDVHKLFWIPDKNYREFLIVRQNQNDKDVFVPEVSYCRVRHPPLKIRIKEAIKRIPSTFI